jgi:putative protease
MKSKTAKKKPVKKTAKKKAVVKKPAKKIVQKEKKLGKITHYFDKIKVAVIKLSDALSVGEAIRIEGGESTNFKQKVVSMEINGEKVKKAPKGKQVGVKVKEKVRDGYKVFKV